MDRVPKIAIPASGVNRRREGETTNSWCSIGASDLLIVAHALAVAQIVIAEEQREFLRVQDLWGENQLQILDDEAQ